MESTLDHVGTRDASSLLHDAVARYGERRFIVTPDGLELSYREFGSRVDRLASSLANRGILSGSRVLIHLATSPELVVLLFSLYRLGAVAVMSNTGNTAREIESLCRRARCEFAITDTEFDVDAIRESDGGLSLGCVRHGTSEYHSLLVKQTHGHEDAADLDASIGSDAPATMLFTSGTTAAPKAVTFTHGNQLHSGVVMSQVFGVAESDLLMHHFPLFHMNGLGQVFAVLVSGASLLLVNRFRSSEFDPLIDRFRPTITFLNSTHIKMIREVAEPRTEASPLRVVGMALQMADEHYDWFESRYGDILREVYGMTESITLCLANPAGAKRRGSCGLPIPGYEARIVDEHGEPVGPGQRGTLHVRGNSRHALMQGYEGQPDATAEALVDRWLVTGDITYRDDAGFIFWVDREKNIIKRAGENISAREVEAVLEAHPGVAEAAVMGIPDALREEVPVAMVVASAGGSLQGAELIDELLRHCREQLAAFKVPEQIRIVEEFPRTAVGKVEKKALSW